MRAYARAAAAATAGKYNVINRYSASLRHITKIGKIATDRLGKTDDMHLGSRTAVAGEFSEPPEPACAMHDGQTQCAIQVSRPESENSESYASPQFSLHQWWGEAPQWFWVYKLVIIALIICVLLYSELQTSGGILSQVISAAAKK